MDNHFHLLLEIPQANLSKAMHHLNTSYANLFRFKYRLVGSVFQGRFKAILGSKRFIRQAYKKVEAGAKIINDREQWETRSLRKVEVDDVFESLLVDMRIPEDEIWSRRRGNAYRKLLVHGLRKYTEANLREIGMIMKMDYAAVSEVSRRFAEEIEKKKASSKFGNA